MRASLLFSLLALSVGTAPAAQAQAAPPAAPPLTTIGRLDLQRYLGTWHEIAKYPNRFQKRCAGDTTAEYALLEDGRVRVTNRCRTADGGTEVAVGVARRVGDADSATLKVRFAPAWLSFLDAVWGDYWVVDLDPDYTLAAVSEPSRRYLWILSRNKKVDTAAYEALLGRLARLGFDLGRLEKTPLSG